MEKLQHQPDQSTAQLAALREIGRAINAAWELQATLALITRKTAEVMGMDNARQTIVRIADCILVWLDDLLMMPPKPDDLVEHAAQKALAAEATMTINGESKTFEVR